MKCIDIKMGIAEVQEAVQLWLDKHFATKVYVNIILFGEDGEEELNVEVVGEENKPE